MSSSTTPKRKLTLELTALQEIILLDVVKKAQARFEANAVRATQKTNHIAAVNWTTHKEACDALLEQLTPSPVEGATPAKPKAGKGGKK